MNRLSERKIILITRRSRLEELISRHNTAAQARFYVEHLGGDFSDYLLEDTRYKDAVSQAQEAIESCGRLQRVDRSFVPNFIFGRDDIVVAVGQDGLVANALKYLDRQPLVGVNPDPARWDGVLLPFLPGELRAVLVDVLADRRPSKEITMAKAALNDGQSLYAVNDLFIGQRGHMSARYQLQWGGKSEEQSSSGIIVSTGLGSTGWLSSILAGAARISGGGKNTGGKYQPQWDSDTLQYTVREPFPSKATQTSLVFGKVTARRTLTVVSQMPENGVIFSDGMESDALEFPSGIAAVISVAEKKGRLVV